MLFVQIDEKRAIRQSPLKSALYLRLRLQRRRFCTDLPQADAAIFGMFFGFASRNRRRSADEEKLPENQGFANITASRLAARKKHGETSPCFLVCAKDSSRGSRTLFPAGAQCRRFGAELPPYDAAIYYMARRAETIKNREGNPSRFLFCVKDAVLCVSPASRS